MGRLRKHPKNGRRALHRMPVHELPRGTTAPVAGSPGILSRGVAFLKFEFRKQANGQADGITVELGKYFPLLILAMYVLGKAFNAFR